MMEITILVMESGTIILQRQSKAGAALATSAALVTGAALATSAALATGAAVGTCPNLERR